MEEGVEHGVRAVAVAFADKSPSDVEGRLESRFHRPGGERPCLVQHFVLRPAQAASETGKAEVGRDEGGLVADLGGADGLRMRLSGSGLSGQFRKFADPGRDRQCGRAALAGASAQPSPSVQRRSTRPWRAMGTVRLLLIGGRAPFVHHLGDEIDGRRSRDK
ncbi:hypothetical protein [Streptomyces sp. DW26H14]|uniref:hypothetical protein n=1 Tax=Streptomyces sp. DW26H14 TaxID=3435395 RepID=UPI00403E2D20